MGEAIGSSVGIFVGDVVGALGAGAGRYVGLESVGLKVGVAYE